MADRKNTAIRMVSLDFTRGVLELVVVMILIIAEWLIAHMSSVEA